MIRYFAMLAVAVLLLASAVLGQEAIVSGSVVSVVDGDTIKVLAPGNQLLRVRLSWIDAPEKSQAFGQGSKQHLSELVFGREVELHTHGLDRYGRTLAVVMLDGVDINLEQDIAEWRGVIRATFQKRRPFIVFFLSTGIKSTLLSCGL